MDFDLEVKLAVYGHFATTGQRPSPREIGTRVGAPVEDVRDAYGRLRSQRVLVLEEDGESIRMAPPFSGVPTQHVVKIEDRTYFANCAWDSLGIPAALHDRAAVASTCGQSGLPLLLPVPPSGPVASDWLFHCAVPASHWWDDIVFT